MDEKHMLSAWALGADARYPWAVRCLKRAGLPFRLWDSGDTESLTQCLTGADMLLLPLNGFQGELLRMGDAELEGALLPHVLQKGALVIGGNIPEALEHWLQLRGIRYVNVLEQETFQMENAAVTAEGALALAMEHMERTIQGAKVLVIGWGRIGKCLAQKLKALGADVTVSARRERDWCQIKALGLEPEETGAWHQGLELYDWIVNTVPAPVFQSAETRKEDALLMELASLPGGFPETWKGSVLTARGLPGKYAPRTAGAILGEAVLRIIWEGGTLE